MYNNQNVNLCKNFQFKKIADRATVQVQSFELRFSNVSKYPLHNNEKVYCQTNNHHSHVVTFISVLEISDTMILYGRNYLPTSVWLVRLSWAGVISLKDVDNVIQCNIMRLLCYVVSVEMMFRWSCEIFLVVTKQRSVWQKRCGIILMISQ